jgi:parvulin-like peptidyl-prolyl isomerase
MLAACLMCLTGCLNGKAADNVVATFEGGNLTIEDLRAHYGLLKKKARYKDAPERLTSEYVLDHAVNMELIIAKGLKEKLHLDPWIRAQIHGFMSDLFLKIMQEKLVPKIDREDFTDEEVRAYYQEHRESYRTPPLYGVRIIKSPDKETLSNARSDIEAGRISFQSAAEQYSEDEASKKNGGYIGKRTLDRYRPVWRSIIERLRLNEISEAEIIGDAYFLFQLVEKTEPRPFTYDEKKAYVRNDLLYSRYRDAWRQVYDQFGEEFSLKIDEGNEARFHREMDPA